MTLTLAWVTQDPVVSKEGRWGWVEKSKIFQARPLVIMWSDSSCITPLDGGCPTRMPGVVSIDCTLLRQVAFLGSWFSSWVLFFYTIVHFLPLKAVYQSNFCFSWTKSASIQLETRALTFISSNILFLEEKWLFECQRAHCFLIRQNINRHLPPPFLFPSDFLWGVSLC